MFYGLTLNQNVFHVLFSADQHEKILKCEVKTNLIMNLKKQVAYLFACELSSLNKTRLIYQRCRTRHTHHVECKQRASV